MISVSQRTIGGESVWLLLAEPNWIHPFRASLAYETETAEAIKGSQSRRPLRAAPRLAVSYRFLASESDLEAIRNLIGNLDDARVAVPFWPDDSGQSYDPLLDSQVKVGFDEGFANIAIGEGGSTPAGARVLPLIIGRLKRPVIDFLTPGAADVTFTLTEESPWVQRLDIVPFVAGYLHNITWDGQSTQGWFGNGTTISAAGENDDGPGVPPGNAIKAVTQSDRHRYSIPDTLLPDPGYYPIEFDVYIPPGQQIIGKSIVGAGTAYGVYAADPGYPSTWQEGLHTYKGTYQFISTYRFLGVINGHAAAADTSYMLGFRVLDPQANLSLTTKFDLDPNWVRPPRESSRDNLDSTGIGDGRESSIEGDGTTRWRQEAGFLVERDFTARILSWFKQHKGSFGAFEMDGFFDPGTDTPQAPHVFDGDSGRGWMRFGSDVLKVDFISPGIAEITAQFEQVRAVTGEQADGRADLFEIYHEADPTDVARLTSAEYPISADGHTWQPARISMPKYVSSLKLEADKAEVTVDLRDLPQVAPILRHETRVPVRCRILEADLSTDPATTYALTSGKARGWKLTGQRAKFSIEPFAGVLSRKIPATDLSTSCPYCLFDANCASRRPAEMARENWRVTGQFWQLFSGHWYRIVSLSSAPAHLAANPTGWFDWGWIEIGSGIDTQYRNIESSYYLAAGDDWNDVHGQSPVLHIKVDTPLRVDLLAQGSSCVLYAGCAGTFDVCGSKFGNAAAFGGAPFAPKWILMKPGAGTAMVGK